MSEFIYIYIYTVIQNAEVFLWLMLVLGGLAAGFLLLASAMSADLEYNGADKKDKHEKLKSAMLKTVKSRLFIVSFSVLSIITVFLPSEKDVKTIIAGGLVWKGGSSMVEVEGIDKLPENLVAAMNAFLVGVSEEKEGK